MDDRFKFRAWDGSEMYDSEKCCAVMGNNGHWAYSEGSIYRATSDIDDCVLMQCTGLKDKNGTLIYEGDILATENLDGEDPDGGICDKWERALLNNQPVEWDSESCSIVGLPEVDYNSVYNKRFTEIIGNIYENPDLIK